MLRNIEPTNQSMQSENKPIEQTFNSNQNIVKTQNNALQSNQELHIENVNNPQEVKTKVYNYLQNSVISLEISKPIVNTDSNLKSKYREQLSIKL